MRSFDLITSPVPATTFRFPCEIQPIPVGSRNSQGITMSGILAPVFSRFMGERIAQSFSPVLAGLARQAASTS